MFFSRENFMKLAEEFFVVVDSTTIDEQADFDSVQASLDLYAKAWDDADGPGRRNMMLNFISTYHNVLNESPLKNETIN